MMTKKRQLKLVHVGEYVAEVEVELIYTDEGWSPYLSLSDALKLDEVRELLRQGEFEVGEEDDFENEVELTGQNEALMGFLAERRSHGQRIPLAEVKEKLGLE
jgi:hypothetical protein